MDYVEIEWLDANSEDTWADVGAELEPATCISRGWLMNENEVSIVLAGTVGFEAGGLVEDSAMRISIPKGMIKSMKPFPTRRKRRSKASEQEIELEGITEAPQ